MDKFPMWAVVRVWRGLPDGVELFALEEDAITRQNELKREIGQEDEVGIFRVPEPSGTGISPASR